MIRQPGNVGPITQMHWRLRKELEELVMHPPWKGLELVQTLLLGRKDQKPPSCRRDLGM